MINYNCTKLLTVSAAACTLKELLRQVTLQYAVHWREIGIELGLTGAKLNVIKVNYPQDIEQRCYIMFSEWMMVDATASWEKLLTAIESLGLSGDPIRSKNDTCTVDPLTSSFPRVCVLTLLLYCIEINLITLKQFMIKDILGNVRY